MHRQLKAGFPIHRAALVAVCTISFAPAIYAPLPGLPKATPLITGHYYELAALPPVAGGTANTESADRIATKVGHSICKSHGQPVHDLLQEQAHDHSLEIVEITSVAHGSKDIELKLKFSWDVKGEEAESDPIKCDNTPAESCVQSRMDVIVNDILVHDCKQHNGVNSCFALKH